MQPRIISVGLNYLSPQPRLPEEQLVWEQGKQGSLSRLRQVDNPEEEKQMALAIVWSGSHQQSEPIVVLLTDWQRLGRSAQAEMAHHVKNARRSNLCQICWPHGTVIFLPCHLSQQRRCNIPLGQHRGCIALLLLHPVPEQTMPFGLY